MTTPISNPISAKTRSYVYIGGLIFTATTIIATAVLNTLGLTEWINVFTVANGAITTLVATLARANLTEDVDPTIIEGAVEPEFEQPEYTRNPNVLYIDEEVLENFKYEDITIPKLED